MTSPVIHILGAFFALIIVARLFAKNIPIEHLAMLSFSTLLPDIIDKSLTGGRFPFHSLLVSGIILIALNFLIRQFWHKNPKLPPNLKLVPPYFLLASIAFLIHPIMDLEGFVPLFYPLDMRGYSFDINIGIQQALPPKITNFVFEFVSSPYDYSMTYDHEGDLINTLDVLFIIIFISVVIIKGLFLFIERVTTPDTDETKVIENND
jgi:hypothetical protein